jgi:hypothetical protein
MNGSAPTRRHSDAVSVIHAARASAPWWRDHPRACGKQISPAIRDVRSRGTIPALATGLNERPFHQLRGYGEMALETLYPRSGNAGHLLGTSTGTRG